MFLQRCVLNSAIRCSVRIVVLGSDRVITDLLVVMDRPLAAEELTTLTSAADPSLPLSTTQLAVELSIKTSVQFNGLRCEILTKCKRYRVSLRGFSKRFTYPKLLRITANIRPRQEKGTSRIWCNQRLTRNRLFRSSVLGEHSVRGHFLCCRARDLMAAIPSE